MVDRDVGHGVRGQDVDQDKTMYERQTLPVPAIYVSLVIKYPAITKRGIVTVSSCNRL